MDTWRLSMSGREVGSVFQKKRALKGAQSLSFMLSSCSGGSAFFDSFPIIKGLNLQHCRMLDRKEQTKMAKKRKKQRGNDLIIIQNCRSWLLESINLHLMSKWQKAPWKENLQCLCRPDKGAGQIMATSSVIARRSDFQTFSPAAFPRTSPSAPRSLTVR